MHRAGLEQRRRWPLGGRAAADPERRCAVAGEPKSCPHPRPWVGVGGRRLVVPLITEVENKKGKEERENNPKESREEDEWRSPS